jgi:GrpB-like predicted nucleotidyltransferase (UPF0157 family)
MIDPNEKIKLVELTKYNPEWANIFSVAANEIKLILKENCIQIHHIGSTAIPNIYAKPIVDVLPVVKDISLVDSLNHEFEKLGYVCMGEYGISGRRFYWKSKTKRTLNIHLFEEGAPELKRNLLFKDFMLEHDDYAQAYSLLKQSLAEVFPRDIENYVNGKSSFVQMINYKTGSAKSVQLNAKDNITIEPYNPVWLKLAKAEIKAIKGMAGQLAYISIEHIGSTAVAGLSSKPIIDILITVQSMGEANHWYKPLETLAYVFSEENSDKSHWKFSKGKPPFGEKRTHHVHIVKNGTR